MGLYPPWQLIYQSKDETVTNSVGYHPIWNPPAGEHEISEDATQSGLRVNIIQIGIQFSAVIILINIGNYAFRSKNLQSFPESDP